MKAVLIFAFTTAAHAQDCAGLQQLDAKKLPSPATVITSAKTNAQPADHCEVLGKINERTGANGQTYAIKFHLRLPRNWNNGFFFEGGGGSNGNLGNALGNLQGGQRANALSLGYAVVSQDSGHDNATNNDPARNGTVTFGHDPQARLDFGYNSYDQVTQTAKAIIQIYYGKPPQRSYYVGCSEGGREGMIMSQRFPTYFDGILACAPGFRLPKAAVFGHASDAQALATVATAAGTYDRFGEPLLTKTFTDEDLDLASQSIVSACDTLDGLADGMIQNFPACTADLVSAKLKDITCKGAKRNTCLSAAQVAALLKIYGGAKNSKGETMYSDWAFDRGLGGQVNGNYNQGWRIWKIGAYDAPANSSIIATLGSAAASALFVTPPVTVASTGAGPMDYLLKINYDTDAAKLAAETSQFPTSVLSFMMADSTNLSAFKQHSGKLIIVQGVSDPVFSINDTIHWWNDLNKVQNGAAADFVRLFAVPGMNHCNGGPATDQYNAFAALVDWVEKSGAPDKIIATAGANTPWPNRTRPLCVYPAQPRYKGSGSIEDAVNFACERQ